MAEERRRQQRGAVRGQGGSRTGIPSGNYCFKPGAPISLYRARFEGRSTIIRPLPALALDDDGRPTGKFAPYRHSAEPGEAPSFLINLTLAAWVGYEKNRLSWLLWDPLQADAGEYNLADNPYVVLREALYRAAKPNSDEPDTKWLPFIKGRQAPIPDSKVQYFSQVLVYKQDKKLFVGGEKVPKGLGERDRIPVIDLSRAAGEAWLDAYERLKDEGEVDMTSHKWEEIMYYGNMCSPKTGRFITIYNPDKESFGDEEEAEGGEDWRKGRKRRGDDDSEGFVPFKIHVDDRLILKGRRTKHTPALTAEEVATVKGKLQFWDDILHFPDHDEQCLHIARALSNPPIDRSRRRQKYCSAREVLDFAWADHPDFFTDAVNKVLDAKRKKAHATGHRAEEEEGEEAEDRGERRSGRKKSKLLKGKGSQMPAGGKKRKRDEDEDDVRDEDEDDLAEDDEDLDVDPDSDAGTDVDEDDDFDDEDDEDEEDDGDEDDGDEDDVDVDVEDEPDDDEEEDEEEDEEDAEPRAASRKSKPKSRRDEDEEEEEDEDAGDDDSVLDEEDEEDEDDAPAPKSKTAGKKKSSTAAASRGTKSSGKQAAASSDDDEDEEGEDDDEDEEGEITTDDVEEALAAAKTRSAKRSGKKPADKAPAKKGAKPPSKPAPKKKAAKKAPAKPAGKPAKMSRKPAEDDDE